VKLAEIKMRIDVAERLRSIAEELIIEERRELDAPTGNHHSTRFRVCLCGGESDAWKPREMKHRDDCIGVQALKLAELLEAPISLS